MMMKIIFLSVLFILALRFNGAQTQNLERDIESSTVCSMDDMYRGELPLCGTYEICAFQ